MKKHLTAQNKRIGIAIFLILIGGSVYYYNKNQKNKEICTSLIYYIPAGTDISENKESYYKYEAWALNDTNSSSIYEADEIKRVFRAFPNKNDAFEFCKNEVSTNESVTKI
ncbi:MAG: hypothetical protein RI996_266 [Candidatus Parcubacteria bacterium]|jgi:hypothetical protein